MKMVHNAEIIQLFFTANAKQPLNEQTHSVYTEYIFIDIDHNNVAINVHNIIP